MNTNQITHILVLLLLTKASVFKTDIQAQTVQLRTRTWEFCQTHSAWSCIDSQIPQTVFSGPEDVESSFTLKMLLDIKPFESDRIILDIEKALTVRLRQHDPRDRVRQNYPAFKMPNGSVPVLEATLVLHSREHPDWTDMTVGIPLAMLKNPEGEHELVLNFTGAHWTMVIDGEMHDNDFPFGYPAWGQTHTWKLEPDSVVSASLFFPAIRPILTEADRPETSPGIQYWLPKGHNNWVGDVATIFHQDRYHVFYLYDRRHHQSKFGCGAHYFEHLSTMDFKTWIEHEAATPLEEQWECIGTGVPFVFKDTLCLSYGLHTTRIYPKERTTLPAQLKFLQQHGRTGIFRQGRTAGFPAGSSYSVSTDGVSKFQKSRIMFHPCENPSIYTNPDGKLQMIANYGSKGIWESRSLNDGWRCISPDFPPGGDCTFFFRWGKFDYIIGGFTGLWSKPAHSPNSAYSDLVRRGLDFYDGLNVPSITNIGDNRFLMAGWIPIRGWGGNLIIRELIQFANGRIGSKWMHEITPRTAKPVTLAPNLTHESSFSTISPWYILTCELLPKKIKQGKLGIVFLPADGDQAACELQFDLDNQRAQFGPGSLITFAEQQKSLREGGAPHQVGNYAIENLMGMDRPFTIRVMVKCDDKIGGSLIDAEIAGQRTMISYRPDLTVSKALFRLKDVELKNIVIKNITL
jgi:hypothetical protein